MQISVKEKVEKLRQEIAEITMLNRSYVDRNSKNWGEKAAYARRQERLQEIKDELAALNDWKRT